MGSGCCSGESAGSKGCGATSETPIETPNDSTRSHPHDEPDARSDCASEKPCPDGDDCTEATCCDAKDGDSVSSCCAEDLKELDLACCNSIEERCNGA